MHRWTCEQCERRPGLRADRGHCGRRPMGRVSGAERDEEGRLFVPGRIVAPGTRSERLSEARFYRCPVAAVCDSWVGQAVTTHRRLSSDALRATVRLDGATRAMTTALDVLDVEVDGLRAMQIEREQQQRDEQRAAAAAARARRGA